MKWNFIITVLSVNIGQLINLKLVIDYVLINIGVTCLITCLLLVVVM